MKHFFFCFFFFCFFFLRSLSALSYTNNRARINLAQPSKIVLLELGQKAFLNKPQQIAQSFMTFFYIHFILVRRAGTSPNCSRTLYCSSGRKNVNQPLYFISAVTKYFPSLQCSKRDNQEKHQKNPLYVLQFLKSLCSSV